MTRDATLDPEVLDLDEVVRLVHGADVAAEVAQTGGGCATIFAGDVLGLRAHSGDPEQLALHETMKQYPARGDLPAWEARQCDGTCESYEAAAGPGWFDGEWWTKGRGHVGDFYVGEDREPYSTEPLPERPTEADVARVLVEVVRRVREALR